MGGMMSGMMGGMKSGMIATTDHPNSMYYIFLSNGITFHLILFYFSILKKQAFN